MKLVDGQCPRCSQNEKAPVRRGKEGEGAGRETERCRVEQDRQQVKRPVDGDDNGDQVIGIGKKSDGEAPLPRSSRIREPAVRARRFIHADKFPAIWTKHRILV